MRRPVQSARLALLGTLALRPLCLPAAEPPCGSDVLRFLEAAANSPAAAAAALSAPLSSGACVVDGVTGSTPLHEVARMGGPLASGMVSLLVGRYASVLAVDIYGATPLHVAAEQGALAAAAGICRAAELSGDKTNLLSMHNGRSMTALDLAVAAGNVATAKLLVQYGSLHSKTFEGSCPGPLLDAVLLSDTARLSQAVNSLSDPTSIRNCSVPPEGQRRSLLHLAAAAADLSRPPAGARVARALIARGVNASHADLEGETPLATAARTDQADVVLALLSAGAAVAARDAEGSTPLHDAARAGAQESALYLLSHGADATAVDRAGNSPMDLAQQQGHDVVAAAIQQVALGGTPSAQPAASGGAHALLSEPSTVHEDDATLGIILATVGVAGGTLAALVLAYALRGRCWAPSSATVAALPGAFKPEAESPRKPGKQLEDVPKAIPRAEPPGIVPSAEKTSGGGAAPPRRGAGAGGPAGSLAQAAEGDSPEQPTVVLVPRRPRAGAGKSHSPPAARALRSTSPRVRSYRGAPPQMSAREEEPPGAAARGRSSPCKPPPTARSSPAPPDTAPPHGAQGRRVRRLA